MHTAARPKLSNKCCTCLPRSCPYPCPSPRLLLCTTHHPCNGCLHVCAYLCAGLLLAALSYLLLCVVLVLELQDRLVITARWMVRAPLVLVATSEAVKLRFVVLQQVQQPGVPDAWGYFFWLYCAFVAVQVRIKDGLWATKASRSGDVTLSCKGLYRWVWGGLSFRLPAARELWRYGLQ